MKKISLCTLSFSLFAAMLLCSSASAEEVIKEAEGKLEPKYSKVLKAPKNEESKPKSKVLKEPAEKELTGKSKVLSKAEGKERKPKSSALIGPEGLKNLEKRKTGVAPVLTSEYLEKAKDKKLEKKANMITIKDGKRVEDKADE